MPTDTNNTMNKSKLDPLRVTKIYPFRSQYEWKDINFPSHVKDVKQ